MQTLYDWQTGLVTVRHICLLAPDPWSGHGEVVGHDVTDLPYEMVEAYREAQTTTLEERFELYAERGW